MSSSIKKQKQVYLMWVFSPQNYIPGEYTKTVHSSKPQKHLPLLVKYENGKQIHGHSQSVTDSSLIHGPALDPSPHWQCVESCAPVEVYLHPDSGISEEDNYRKR